MKKLSRKLLLSILSLGVAVVTLSTTTFAWYTSITSAEVTGPQGTTSGTADGSILVAATSGSEVWGTTVTVSEVKENVALIPVQAYGTGSNALTFSTLAGTAAESVNYLQFSVYVKYTQATSTDAVSIYLKNLTIENALDELTTTGDHNFIIADYTNGWADTYGSVNHETATNHVYAVDAVQTLCFATASVANSQDASYASGQYPVGKTAYDAQGALVEEDILDSIGLGSAANAVDYYNAVMGLSGEDAISASKATTANKYTAATEVATTKGSLNPIVVGEVPANQSAGAVIKITFTVWMNGWDAMCFDACREQNFNISFGLTTDENSVGIYA